MKKISYVFCMTALFILIQSCSDQSKKSNNAGGSPTQPILPSGIPSPIPSQSAGLSVQQVFVQHCIGCHSATGQMSTLDLTQEASAKAKGAEILRRVQLAANTPDFMPKNSAPLSSTELVLLQQWQQSGFANWNNSQGSSTPNY